MYNLGEKGLKQLRASCRGTHPTTESDSGTGPSVPGRSGREGGSEGFTTTDRRIPSWDGTELAATLYEPASGCPAPTVIMTHHWGLTRGFIDLQRKAERYASDGYAVLAYDSRGYGDSDGSAGLNGPKEVRDVSALIDWLVETEIAEPDPRIGMDGMAYGGAIQLLAAAADDRIDAIVPQFAWNDLEYSLAPNGVIKAGWLVLLYAVGTMASWKPGSDGGLDDRFARWYAETKATNEIPDDIVEAFDDRSIAGREHEVDAPTLLISGWNDSWFKPSETLTNFRAIGAGGTETALALYDGGHSLSELKSQPEVRDYLFDLAHRWLDRHVRGQDVRVPTVSLYLPQQERWRTHETFPPVDVEPRTLPLAAGTDRPDSPLARRSLSTPSTQTFEWEFETDTEICGAPALDLYVDVDGQEARLFVTLKPDRSWDFVRPNTAVGEVYRLDGAGEHRLSIEYPPIQQFVDAGDTFTLELSVKNLFYVDAADCDGITIHHDEAHPSSVTLPIR